MEFGQDTVEHGTPALGADGRVGGQDAVGSGSVLEDFIAARSGGVLEKGASTIYTEDDDVLVGPFGGRKFYIRCFRCFCLVGVL